MNRPKSFDRAIGGVAPTGLAFLFREFALPERTKLLRPFLVAVSGRCGCAPSNYVAFFLTTIPGPERRGWRKAIPAPELPSRDSGG
jgi:hypothetical protein